MARMEYDGDFGKPGGGRADENTAPRIRSNSRLQAARRLATERMDEHGAYASRLPDHAFMQGDLYADDAECNDRPAQAAPPTATGKLLGMARRLSRALDPTARR